MLKRTSRTAMAQRQARHQRHEDQQHVRRQMGPHHGADEAEARGHPRDASKAEARPAGSRRRRSTRAWRDRRRSGGGTSRRVALADEPASERIQREEGRQAADHAPRSAEARQRRGNRRPSPSRQPAPRPPRPVVTPAKISSRGHPSDGVEHDHGPVAGHGSAPAPAGRPGRARRRPVRRMLTPSRRSALYQAYARPRAIVHEARERGLFDRQERTHLVAARG